MPKYPINLPLHRSVTARIKDISQPRGGYLNPKMLATTQFDEGSQPLYPQEEENVHATIVGIAVDYLTRFMTGAPADEAFAISLLGAVIAQREELAQELKLQVKGLDTASITAAMKLSGFDSAFRGGLVAYRPVEDISPNQQTVENVAIMVRRSMAFFDAVGPKTLDGFTFEGGYTEYVSSGDGDFLTADTLWDFKVSKKLPTKDHTLQLLMYWQMGLRSVHPEFQSIRRLGIFNPRLNAMFTCDVASISSDVVREVADTVIGYNLEPMDLALE